MRKVTEEKPRYGVPVICYTSDNKWFIGTLEQDSFFGKPKPDKWVNTASGFSYQDVVGWNKVPMPSDTFQMNDKQAKRILKEMEEMFGDLPDPEVYPKQFQWLCKWFHWEKNRKKIGTEIDVKA